jgi:surface antigen
MESKLLRPNTESFYLRFLGLTLRIILVKDQMKISNYNRLLIFFVLLFLLSGCATATWQENKKAIIGGVGGAAAGGLIASAFKANAVGIVGGALLGGLVGGAVGNRMDAADRREAYHATQYSLEKNPSGTETKWHNPDSGNYGSVTPLNSQQVSNGRYCREYSHQVTINSQTEQAHGTACRQPDGSWQINS